MASIPYSFASAAEFLTAAKAAKRSADAFFSNRCRSLEHIVTTSVSGSTFRAFHMRKYRVRPSKFYRGWCTEWLGCRTQDVNALRTVQDMREFIASGAQALHEEALVRTRGHYHLGVGRAAKLLNLTLKHVIWYTAIPDEQRSRVVELLDVPLDSYTLQGIRLLAPELQIPSTASMGWVSDLAHYSKIQDVIRKLCGSEARPVDFEFAAWNAAHPEIASTQPRCGGCDPAFICYSRGSQDASIESPPSGREILGG